MNGPPLLVINANNTCVAGKNGNDKGWRGGVNVKLPGCTSAAAEDVAGKAIKANCQSFNRS
jgi:hypothetical protein